jgi:D-aminopeptidase
MTRPDSARLDAVVEALPHRYAGPGGAIAVIKDGEVLVRNAWGWANAERRIPFTPRTLFRMCSVTKQFTCGLALESFPDLSALDGHVQARMPHLQVAAPSATQLCHNQSGLRDYWAVAMLLGSPAEAPFGDSEAAGLIAATRSLQFTPGTRFSYVNQNFRVLSEIIQDRSDHGFAELLRRRIFDRVGMETAFLAADTRAMPDGTDGYEGTQTTGFRAARNNIIWTGDAGLGASLDDMIAWERHIDAGRDNPAALYNRLAAPVVFADGNPATYGFGLGRSTAFGRAVTGHGGALRGWRSHRLHVASERVSIVVLFNHLADAGGAAMDLLGGLLGEIVAGPDLSLTSPTWTGAYIEPETNLSVRIEAANPGTVRLRFGHSAASLDLQPDGTAVGQGGTRLSKGPDGVWLDRPGENCHSRLAPLAPESESSNDVTGRYLCRELGAELTVEAPGSVLYGAFSGPLGAGRMELLDPVGADVWVLPCPRALDHTPPGDWTLAFRRDAAGAVTGATVGCWLARGLNYDRLGPA